MDTQEGHLRNNTFLDNLCNHHPLLLKIDRYFQVARDRGAVYCWTKQNQP